MKWDAPNGSSCDVMWLFRALQGRELVVILM